MVSIYDIPLETYYALSVVLLTGGLYFSLTRPRKYVEYTILTTILSPLPSLIALYVQVGYTYLFQVTLFGYAIIVLSVSLPFATGEFPKLLREIYADTRRYYVIWLAKSGTLEYIDAERFSRQLTLYTYLLLIFGPIIAFPLYVMGLFIYGFMILVGVFLIVVLMPYLTVLVVRSGYVSSLLDELPQVLQLFLIHHRSGETIMEVFRNIAASAENLPSWSKLTKSLLLQSEMTGHGIDKVISEWIEVGKAPEKIKNFLEGYLYTWLAGGNIEAYVKRWLDEEEVLWVDRIKSYYERMLVFAEIAIMAAVSPIAVLLIAFLSPGYGIVLLEMLIFIFPVMLYIIPMVYMSSVKPRMASTPKFIPNIKHLLIAIGLAIIPIFILNDIFSKFVGFLVVLGMVLLPFEIKWNHGVESLDRGVLRWLETAMHYMLAGSLPLDAIQKSREMIKDSATLRLINKMTYNIESGRLSIKAPTPFLTHTLHIVSTGIVSGALSPELLYMNVNILYRIKNTIEESKRSVFPAIVLGMITPFIVLLTIGIGVWFVNTISVFGPETTSFPMPLPTFQINLDALLPYLYVFSIVLGITIGSIVSTTYSNYFYSTYIHVPILLSLLITLLLGSDYFVQMFEIFMGL